MKRNTPLKRTRFKSHKHKRTQATDIPQSVKDAVWERDGHCCVWCGSANGMPEAHYLSRRNGGKGIEQNILTLCRFPSEPGKSSCHDIFDHGTRMECEVMRDYFAAYLKSHYPDWDESKLIYRREI